MILSSLPSLPQATTLIGGVPTDHIMILSAVLFGLGVLGFLIRRDLIVVFMSIELMLNAGNLAFLAAARERFLDPEGQVYTIFVITIAAVEAAVGLALLIAFFRLKSTLDVETATELEG